MGQTPSSSPPTPDEILDQLGRILRDQRFANSARMGRFLRLAVQKALAGDGDSLKEYLIGIEVFDKPPSFDPRLDSIVRVEARRLRRKLRAYYQAEGVADPIVVDFMEGRYVPTFRRAAGAQADPERWLFEQARAALDRYKRTVVMLDSLTERMDHGTAGDDVAAAFQRAWAQNSAARAAFRAAAERCLREQQHAGTSPEPFRTVHGAA